MKRLLIIEDDWDLACLMTLRLGAAGYEVEAAPDGEIGLYRVKTIVPDAVLLDMLIPRLDGWEVSRRLHKNAATRSIPIIAITGLRQDGLLDTLASVGIKNYVAKPLEPAKLLATVKKVLA